MELDVASGHLESEIVKLTDKRSRDFSIRLLGKIKALIGKLS